MEAEWDNDEKVYYCKIKKERNTEQTTEDTPYFFYWRIMVTNNDHG